MRSAHSGEMLTDYPANQREEVPRSPLSFSLLLHSCHVESNMLDSSLPSCAAHTGQLHVKSQLGLNTKVTTETPRLHKFGVDPLFVFVVNKAAN